MATVSCMAGPLVSHARILNVQLMLLEMDYVESMAVHKSAVQKAAIWLLRIRACVGSTEELCFAKRYFPMAANAPREHKDSVIAVSMEGSITAKKRIAIRRRN